MEPIIMFGRIIASKKHAKSMIKRLNLEFAKEPKIEMALLIDDCTERLVSAGFLTREEACVLENEAFGEYAMDRSHGINIKEDATMTLHERVTEALNAYEFNDAGNGINELIAYAYHLGRCTAAKEACDKAAAVFAEQLARAQAVRYKHLAMKIQGDVRTIYHPDHNQWISMFASDKTDA